MSPVLNHSSSFIARYRKYLTSTYLRNLSYIVFLIHMILVSFLLNLPYCVYLCHLPSYTFLNFFLPIILAVMHFYTCYVVFFCSYDVSHPISLLPALFVYIESDCISFPFCKALYFVYFLCDYPQYMSQKWNHTSIDNSFPLINCDFMYQCLAWLYAFKLPYILTVKHRNSLRKHILILLLNHGHFFCHSHFISFSRHHH